MSYGKTPYVLVNHLCPATVSLLQAWVVMEVQGEHSVLGSVVDNQQVYQQYVVPHANTWHLFSQDRNQNKLEQKLKSLTTSREHNLVNCKVFQWYERVIC